MARRAFVTGITTVVQFMAGVGGPFLDIFFQKSMLDRKTTIATKAVTQTFSHVLRAGYFGSFGGVDAVRSAWRDAGASRSRSPAPRSAADVIERMTDHGFRQWTRASSSRSAWSIWRVPPGSPSADELRDPASS